MTGVAENGISTSPEGITPAIEPAVNDPLMVTFPETFNPPIDCVPFKNWSRSAHPAFVGPPQLLEPIEGCGNPRLVFGMISP
jgi:hypothetical protein